jgi:hypothetical protein
MSANCARRKTLYFSCSGSVALSAASWCVSAPAINSSVNLLFCSPGNFEISVRSISPMRRFVFIVIVFALPLRLWAGVGMMMNMPVALAAPAIVEQVSASHTMDRAPCHETDEMAVAPLVFDGTLASCAGSECTMCTICHMLGLQAQTLDVVSQSPSRTWRGQLSTRLYAAESGSLFKPPVF